MCFHGIWGTVCDDFWDERDAAVVCRQLEFDDRGTQNYKNKLISIVTILYIKTNNAVYGIRIIATFSGAVAVHSARFNSGVGVIHLDDVQCNGSESRLANCSHRGVGVHNCSSSQDAGVICSSG